MPARTAPSVELKDNETIAFMGDSITAWSSNYSLYAQAFLVSRFPGKNLAFHTFGYGGQTAAQASENFKRDVAPFKPTLVFVNFGMNDGKYKPFDEANQKWYLDSQRTLARVIGESGARQVLLTTSPIDFQRRPDGDAYNETLARQADGVLALGKELNLPVTDIFHAMRDTQTRVKKERPGYTMIVDSVHPGPVGHIVMAYNILKHIDMPRVVADITIDGTVLGDAKGAKIENYAAKEGRIEFDLTLPFLPFYVPPEARDALDFVPFQQELNTFQLRATKWNPEQKAVLMVDNKEIATFSAEQLAKGVDLALLDGAPWSEQGRQVLDAALVRGNHVEVLRDYKFRNLPSFAKVQAAQREYLIELGGAMKAMAVPKKYHLALVPSNRVLTSLEISPVYPANSFAGDFEKAYPPETQPETVTWQKTDLQNGVVDFLSLFGNVQNCVVYCRAFVEADAAGKLHLDMGSDDGLTVFVNGRKVHANNTTRGMTIGDDKVAADLHKGRNTLLFRITQNSAGFRFGVLATPAAGITVKQVK